MTMSRGAVRPATQIVRDISSGDPLVIDTNVWVFLTRPQHTRVKYQQEYSAILNDVMREKIQLLHVRQSLLELPNAYENPSKDVWLQQHPGPDGEKHWQARKRYRAQSGERPTLAAEILSALSTIYAISSPCDSEFTLEEVVEVFGESYADGTDAVIALAARASRAAVLTDDQDFGSVPGIRVYTLNRHALSRSQ